MSRIVFYIQIKVAAMASIGAAFFLLYLPGLWDNDAVDVAAQGCAGRRRCHSGAFPPS